MADMNYVSPLTSDLTDYYTKSEVDELQQGDAATYATSAEIVAGDNAVKGWVVSQGFLTEHQDLTNYATKDYVAAAVEDIETGGVSIEVVDTLPAHPEENVIYLTRKSESDTDNIYNEWIWVADTESYELIGDTSSGVIPDLSDYATKQWVEAKGYLVSDNLIGYATVSDLADFATKDYVDDELANKANSADLAAVATSGDYDDLSNKPTIPDISNLAAADISFSNPDKYTFYEHPTVQSVLLEVDNNAVRKSKLATVATSGDYNDLANKPSIPSTSGLASESYVDNAIANINIPDVSNFIDAEQAESIAADEVESKVNGFAADLATVATSGSYNDLTDKPTIPAAPDLTPYATKQELTAKADSASLASVATSGSYNDLSDKPSIPEAGIEGTADGGLAFIYPELLDNSVRKGYVIRSDTPQDELIGWLKSGYWIRLMNSNCQSAIPIGSFGNHNRVFIYTCNVSTGVITSQYYQSGTLSFRGYGWVVRVLPNAFLYIPCSNASNMDTETLNAIKKMRENYLLNYDNTNSGLTATTIQGAIDELAAVSGGGASTAAQLSYDNTNTWNNGTDTDTVQEAIDSLYADVDGMTRDIDGVSQRVDGVERSIADLPPGYELTETYDDRNKRLTLSVVESSGL